MRPTDAYANRGHRPETTKALFISRHQLTMNAPDGAILRDVDERTIEAVPAAIGRPFDGAEVDGNPMPRGCRADIIEMFRLRFAPPDARNPQRSPSAAAN